MNNENFKVALNNAIESLRVVEELLNNNNEFRVYFESRLDEFKKEKSGTHHDIKTTYTTA